MGVAVNLPHLHWGGSPPPPANGGGGELPPPPSATIYIYFLKKTLIKPDIIKCGYLFFLRVFQLMWQPLNGVYKLRVLYADHIELILK
jgi:hypothetical protein